MERQRFFTIKVAGKKGTNLFMKGKAKPVIFTQCAI